LPYTAKDDKIEMTIVATTIATIIIVNIL